MPHHWWDTYGPFDPDPNDPNFPNAGQVVKHHRLLKKWTPAQLGEALDKTARWVQLMEHDNAVPEAISRRRAIATILGIPTILLGLASTEDLTTPAIASNRNRTNLDNTTIIQYQQSLRLYWELYYTSNTYDSVEEIILWTRRLRTLANETSGYYQNQLIELLCQYQQLVAHILRDQQDYDTAFAYANRAVKIARSTHNNELIASALLRRGLISFDKDDIPHTLIDLDTAYNLSKHENAALRGFIAQTAAYAHACVKDDSLETTQALKLFDQAGNIIRQGKIEDDQSFVKLNSGWYHTERAGALLIMKRPTEAFDELDRAEKYLEPDQPRRRAYINIVRAKVYFSTSEFEAATILAEDALTISQAVKSEQNIAYIEELHKKLSKSKHSNSPQVARLGRLLKSY